MDYSCEINLSLSKVYVAGVVEERRALCHRSCALKMLAEGCQWARLETRTKESNMYASWWVENP